MAACSLYKRDVRSTAACSLCKRDVRSDKKILHNESCKDEKLFLENIDDIIVRNRSSKGLEDFRGYTYQRRFALQRLSDKLKEGGKP